MEFLEDLRVKFVKKLGYKPIDASAEKSVDGCLPIYNVWVKDHICFHFIGASRCELIYQTSKMSESEEFDEEWQDFVLNNTMGNQRTCLLGSFLKDKRELLFDMVEECFENDSQPGSDFSMQAGIEQKTEEVLDLEEKVFSSMLVAAKSRDDFYNIIQRSQNLRAEYGARFYEKIQDFLDRHVEMSYNADGENVYNFIEEQAQVYEMIVGIKNDIEFAFNYQIYRADMKELEVFENEAE